jgi:hypothetical protein
MNKNFKEVLMFAYLRIGNNSTSVFIYSWAGGRFLIQTINLKEKGGNGSENIYRDREIMRTEIKVNL